VQYNTGEEELYDLSSDPLELTSHTADPAYAATKQALHDLTMSLCQPLPPLWNQPLKAAAGNAFD